MHYALHSPSPFPFPSPHPSLPLSTIFGAIEEGLVASGLNFLPTLPPPMWCSCRSPPVVSCRYCHYSATRLPNVVRSSLTLTSTSEWFLTTSSYLWYTDLCLLLFWLDSCFPVRHFRRLLSKTYSFYSRAGSDEAVLDILPS